MIFTVTAVEPIGKRTTFAHVNRGDQPHYFGFIEIDAYPPHPRGTALRDLRVAAGVGLREASKRLGLSAVDLSGVEMGSKTFTDEAMWGAAEALLRGTT